MKKGTELLREIFDDCYDENLSMIMCEDTVEGVELISNKLSSNDEWYNYYEVVFSFKGKLYTFEYNKHTSPNVCETNIEYDAFVCLGDTKELEQEKPDILAYKKTEAYLRKRIDFLENELKESKNELKNYKDPFKHLRYFNAEQVKDFAENILIKNGKQDGKVTLVGRLGEFLVDISKLLK